MSYTPVRRRDPDITQEILKEDSYHTLPVPVAPKAGRSCDLPCARDGCSRSGQRQRHQRSHAYRSHVSPSTSLTPKRRVRRC